MKKRECCLIHRMVHDDLTAPLPKLKVLLDSNHRKCYWIQIIAWYPISYHRMKPKSSLLTQMPSVKSPPSKRKKCKKSLSRVGKHTKLKVSPCWLLEAC